MSIIEDMQNASEQNVIREETTGKAEIGNEVASSAEESDSSELSEKLSTKELEEEREEIEKKEQGKAPSREETEKEDNSDSELATVTRSASSTTPDDGMSALPSGVVAHEMKRQAEAEGFKAAGLLSSSDENRQRCDSGHAAVGEWNSLPVLVERLREALELSLATGCRRGDDPTATSSLAESGLSVEVNDRPHTRRSIEQAVLGGYDHDDLELKKDELKFLEDLLLSDIQTALSRLRETLERTDVATLAKHGGVSDSTSKLHLLRLVSSLLSQLQVPQKEATTTNDGENRLITTTEAGALAARKRRPVRHTIGVSAEEIAYARKQLEETSADLIKLSNVTVQRQRESLIVSNNVPNNAPVSVSSDVPGNERHAEEICDKYTKDAINQRQSLRDKNKDCRGDIGTYRLVTVESGEADVPQSRHWCGNVEGEGDAVEKKTNEEQSQVTKLAAVLRERAELVNASRCNVNNNKFVAKKSKIKRANTVDIPSYLKLQANSAAACDNSGCVQLRRPIHVGDKVASNATNNVVMPSFHPRTENDKKFLALINRNNETQATFNVAPAFKSFGYTKATDTLQMMKENWNSRFSNIKTAFDKPPVVNEEHKLSPKPRPAKYFSPQTPLQPTNKRAPTGAGNSSNSLPSVNINVSKPDMGFRHAPSSLFRKIEKPQNPILPPSYHWFKENAPPPGNTLREKARIMFDRNSNVQSQSTSKSKIDANQSSQKASFPRPPWIERDQNEGKSKEMIAENGRLDYRLFCKQFAPFIGKNTAAEPKTSRNHEEQRKRNEHLMQREIIFSPDEKAVMDGKVSFEIFPYKGSRIQQYRKSNESHREVERPDHDKLDLHSEKNILEQACNRRCNEQNLPESAEVDATLSSSSSIAIQTGDSNNNQPEEEVRVFRAVPRIKRSDRSSVCNDVSVQTYNQPEQPLTGYIETEKEWTTPRYECDDGSTILNSTFHPAKEPRNLVVDHNWNYHTLTTDVVPRNESSLGESMRNLIEEQPFMLNPVESMPYRDIPNYYSPEQRERVLQIDNSRYDNRLPSKLVPDNPSQIYQNYSPDVRSNRNSLESEIPFSSRETDENDISCTNDGDLPEEQNIQNQDISADIGVVTRYTCAIATVASVPDTSETQPAGTGSGFTVSSSPSPSHFRPYVKETSNEITTTEEEIRRHNMLQQSLVRKLQNERVTLNDQYMPVSRQPSSWNQSTKFQLPNTPKVVSPVVTASLSISPNSGLSVTNRVTTLRGQYEQPGGPGRPVQKECSPILNGVSGAMNSNKYPMSCPNKSVRSAVLSKSESWHQLALSNSHHPPLRASQVGLPPTSSHLLKLPKPKSPSFFRTKKQYEASLSSDNVRRMEDKIRRYFDNSNDNVDAKDSKGKCFSLHDTSAKGMMGLSRSRTMPGICDEKLHLVIPASQSPAASLNSADVDKVFDDIFEEATRTNDHRF